VSERDYVLGTHEKELERLGLQHRVWRPSVLDCWQRAGVTTGKRILDIGAGPGYATVDLAEIVGPAGEVVALERSHNFVSALSERARGHGLTNVRAHEIDLMTDDLPKGDYDFSWCRWVLSFVSDAARLITKLAGVMPKGSMSIFHEYGDYETWSFLPSGETHERFREHVVATWKESGGEPDAGRELPALLEQNHFALRSVKPLLFCIRPRDFMWQWPRSFIDVYLPRLQEMGRIDEKFAAQVRDDFIRAEKNPETVMVTPLVLEILAEKL
jgi:SAM-dependent methyltransferase